MMGQQCAKKVEVVAINAKFWLFLLVPSPEIFYLSKSFIPEKSHVTIQNLASLLGGLLHIPPNTGQQKRMFEEIILQYVDHVRNNEDQVALVINYFRAQITPAINYILEENNIYTCLLPVNIAD